MLSNLLIRRRLALPKGILTKVYATAASLIIPEYDAVLDRRNNVLAIVGPDGGNRIIVPGFNIVTDAGDIHLAQRACSESVTNAFTTHEMCSAGTPGKAANRSGFTAIGSSQKVQDGTYPKTADDDADNTGDGVDVRTSRASWAAADFNHGAITHGIITNATPGASEPIFTGYAFAASFAKAATDTLKVFHNCTLNGV